MKNYVVVGGSSGIGFSLTKKLSESGNVFVLSRTPKDVLSIPNVIYISFDATKDTISSEIPEKIDGLAYCPGTINLKPFSRLSEADFLNEFNVNVLGAVRVSQQLLPNLKKSGNASILLFSTVAVQMGMPFHASIAASKGAIEGLTKSLAAELAPTIRVNAIAPSLTNTPLAEKLVSSPEKIEAGNKRHPLARIGTPEDLAEMAEFLLSEKASWISGQILHIDGGMSSLKLM
jgi:NAD(P)-dependent dehydrogenase (short-subunit alcohol dehydrogenase family)